MTSYKGRICGTIGDAGCFSFQQTKHVTAGEGGMVITDTDHLRGRKLALCADKGWPRHLYREHLFLAPNYHLSDLQAAVALAQLRKLERGIEARRRSAAALSSVLCEVKGVTTPPEVPWARHTYFAYQFTIDLSRFTAGRDEMVKAMQAEGVPAIPSYLPRPLHEYGFLADVKMYNTTRCPLECPHYTGTMDYRRVELPRMKDGCARAVFLPWNEKLGEADGRGLGEAIVKVLSHYAR
jgi:dTDP-4-amino-4,6-dideoxygalactose transaminase